MQRDLVRFALVLFLTLVLESPSNRAIGQVVAPAVEKSPGTKSDQVITNSIGMELR